MSDLKNYTLNAETGEFTLSGMDANLIITPVVITEAIEKSNYIPALTKIALYNIVAEQTLDNAIKVMDFLLKAKELLVDNPSVYNIVENTVIIILKQ